MLSDEEKQAIDKLKRSANYFVMPMYETKIILELIEKQQKEIEILNKNMNLLREQNISYKQSIHGLKEMNKIINKKWEDKIKAKIEEYEEMIKVAKTDPQGLQRQYECKEVIMVLQSLLEKE